MMEYLKTFFILSFIQIQFKVYRLISFFVTHHRAAGPWAERCKKGAMTPAAAAAILNVEACKSALVSDLGANCKIAGLNRVVR